VNYSEAWLELDSAQDWTSNAADEVVMHFRGNAVTFFESDDGYIAMSGEGTDVWGTADECRFAYKTLTGDGSMIVRVDSLEEHDIYTKAGLMIRETLDANSIMAISTTHSNNNTALQSRTEGGGNTTTVNESGTGNNAGQLPIWLKLTRTGNMISAERSFDGENWEPIDPETDPSETEVTMANTVYIGLYVCSRDDELSAATFYGVETEGNVSGEWTLAAIGGTGSEQADGMNTIDKLYMALEDNSSNRHDVYVPEVTAVGWGSWYEWTIPQSEFTSNGVDMSRVKKIIVGVGDPDDPMNGIGTIFIDAIGYGHTIVEQ